MSIQTQISFIEAVINSGYILTDIGFMHLSTKKKGFATYISYERNSTLISIWLGPSDWNVETSILSKKRKYEFKDLLEIPSILQWTANNKFLKSSNDRIYDEVIWHMKFITYSLTQI
ncbi:MAG: hypothetical protein CFE21_01055 [Bacteroidetes bacterium B1(2017)]|nr:MAG: hypothetical protein CFE21_01055 [Bacteroidetes bacterium B1(2017)]